MYVYMSDMHWMHHAISACLYLHNDGIILLKIRGLRAVWQLPLLPAVQFVYVLSYLYVFDADN
jgi:hypothetical protein